MEIKTKLETGVAVVSLNGRLDLVSAGIVKSSLSQMVYQGHTKLLIDLGDVSFIDSSGLGALIGGLKAARQAGGDLRIARARDQARMVLELTTLDRVLKIHATVAEALAGY
jgi:anti-anti-sigma factor